MRRLVGLSTLLVVTLAVLALSQRAALGSTTVGANNATLSFVATSPVLSEHQGTWSTTVLVQSAGLCPAKIAFRLVVTTPGDPVYSPGKPEVKPRPPAKCALAPGKVSTVTIVFSRPFQAVPTSAVLVIEATGTKTIISGPASIALIVRRDIGLFGEVWFPFLIGFIVAVLFILMTLYLAPKARHSAWSKPVTSTWSFKDSWATNITAAGAVFGAVLAATGAVTSAFPGIPLYRFAMLDAAYAGVAAVAPLFVGLKSQKAPDNKIQVRNRNLLLGGGG